MAGIELEDLNLALLVLALADESPEGRLAAEVARLLADDGIGQLAVYDDALKAAAALALDHPGVPEILVLDGLGKGQRITEAVGDSGIVHLYRPHEMTGKTVDTAPETVQRVKTTVKTDWARRRQAARMSSAGCTCRF